LLQTAWVDNVLFGLFAAFAQFKKRETIHEIILAIADFVCLSLHMGQRMFSLSRRILPVDS
jgi:hypothetical protein